MKSALVVLSFLAALTSGCCMFCEKLEPYPPHPTILAGTAIPLNVMEPFFVSYYDGSPGGGQNIRAMTARCTDPAACEVDIVEVKRPAFTAAQARVRGMRVGPAQIVIGFLDPSTHTPVEQRLDVRFVAPVKPSALEVGAPSPNNEYEIVSIKDEKGIEQSCVPHGNGATQGELAQRSDHYRCQAAKLTSATLTHYCRDSDCADPREDDLFVCVHHAPGRHTPILGLTLSRHGADPLAERRGALDLSACPTSQ